MTTLCIPCESLLRAPNSEILATGQLLTVPEPPGSRPDVGWEPGRKLEGAGTLAHLGVVGATAAVTCGKLCYYAA